MNEQAKKYRDDESRRLMCRYGGYVEKPGHELETMQINSFTEGFDAGFQYRDAEVFRLREALFKAVKYLDSGILKKHEYVKQLDGSVKMELINTYQGDFVEELRKALEGGE